ncbi:uncharacterized protein [Paramisgurnus dabryanus]|uniref:uncharacterized protein n=1 Tax=Paramisgurnus dabryanus TaxID=90735 RepID=UPI0031F43F48
MDLTSITTLIYYVSLLMSGYHWDFDNIFNGENTISDSDRPKLKPGDLILRAAEHKVGRLFFHAGVNTEDNEVIHFQFETVNDQSKFSWSASSKGKRKISKESVSSFIEDQPYWVFRLKSGIPKDFKDKVKRGMNFKEEYHLLTNNCLHFALRLLGVTQEENDSFMDRRAKNNFEEDSANNIWTNDNSLSPLIGNRVHNGDVYNMMTQTTSMSAFMTHYVKTL